MDGQNWRRVKRTTLERRPKYKGPSDTSPFTELHQLQQRRLKYELTNSMSA